jgi:phospholipid/cholesterol/gamma-HCH transport system substrate-binding protein
MKLRIRYADQVVGAFILIAFAMLTVILVAVGSKQRWFARDYRYESRFTSSAGIVPGSPILLAGFQVGRISSITLNEKNEADVRFVIYDTYVDKVRENSILEVVTSPVGLGTQLLFQPGLSETLLPERSFIPSYDTPEGKRLVAQGLVTRPPKDDTVAQLLANVNPLMENLDTLLNQLNAAFEGSGTGPLAATVADAAGTVEGINALVAQLNESMTDVRPQVDGIMANVKETTDSIATMSANLAQTTESLRDPTGLVPKLLDPKGSLKTLLDDNNRLFDRVDNSLAAIEGSLDNLLGATATLAEQMPQIAATLENARQAIVSAQDVMEGLKNNPLLRGGIPERLGPQAAPTGLRTTDF